VYDIEDREDHMTAIGMARESFMKAIVQHRYGRPEDVLELRDDVEKPVPADDRVLVRVRASSVNAGDWRRVLADPFIVRLVDGLRKPKVAGLGGDAAGVVEAVGKDVTDLRVGDEVYGIRTGAYAEYLTSKMFVLKPANLTFEQAAAVPVAGITALQALRDKGGVTAGQKVLINGAGGGVGTFAVQIAKAFGAQVTAVTSTANLELVRSIGADHVIDYSRQDFTKGDERYDVVVDIGGTPSLSACRRALTPEGMLVVVGAGKGVAGALGRMAGWLIRGRILRQRVVGFIANVNTQDLVALRELIEAGKVTPVIDRTFSLSQVPEALRYVETERASGKVVITI
jgi:NADPH:quinone reductase-like Zn-dependent oxidoreductase